MFLPGFAGMQWNSLNLGEAACGCYFDDGFMPAAADLPAGSTIKTNHAGSWPLTGGGSADRFCYPINRLIRDAVSCECDEIILPYLASALTF